MSMDRPDWDRYFLSFAKLASTRSTCTRRHHGAIITKRNQILATGYNASPAGHSHCKESCMRQEMNVPSGTRYELCRSIHAEQNALLQAAIHGVSILGGTMYITGYPCIICAKLIANSQLSRIVIADDSLKEENSEKVMLESGLKVDIIIGCV